MEGVEFDIENEDTSFNFTKNVPFYKNETSSTWSWRQHLLHLWLPRALVAVATKIVMNLLHLVLAATFPRAAVANAMQDAPVAIRVIAVAISGAAPTVNFATTHVPPQSIATCVPTA